MTKIYLIRHGKSTANLDENVYLQTFDHFIPLADVGVKQAVEAGKQLEILLKKDLQNRASPSEDLKPKFSVFCSPYKRTIETWENIKKSLDQSFITSSACNISGKFNFDDGEFEEAPLLREQEHKFFKDLKESKSKKEEQANFGKFWYRFRNAESIADVHKRVTIFLNELRLRHIQQDVGEVVVIVAHEITINMLLMNLFKKETHNYGTEVDNCEILEVETRDFIRGITLKRHPIKVD